MEIKIRNEGTARVVELIGEIDAATSSVILERVRPLTSEPGHLVLDMGAVTVMSSAGLRLLLTVARQVQASQHSVEFGLVGASPQIMDTMTVTGFVRFFRFFDTVDDAMKGFNPS